MVTINKTIQNLKPGKQYLITVRPKDADLNLAFNPVAAVRFTIPNDATIPADLSNLVVVGNYKSVMISFNPSNEADLKGYNYQVYLPENIATSGSTFVIVNNATPYLSGFSASNVITVDVPQNSETTNDVNSNTGTTTTTTTEKLYFARVQSVDTTGNVSEWTPIVASTATTLIDSAHIIDLTASKITAGTIGAHTITMAGINSILKSSNYQAANSTFGGTGWKISGDGKAVFNDASIRSSLDIGEDQGTSDATSFHVDVNGNMWIGANRSSYDSAPFRVNNLGKITADSLTLTGTTFLGTGSEIFLGAGNYNNIDTGFYVNSDSLFSLGDKLTWDGTNLTVRGTLRFPDNTEPINEQEAETIAEDAAELAVDGLEENIYEEGFLGGLTINSTQMYYGAGNFSNADTAFYVAKNVGTGQADFSLGNKLTWNGSTLAITGNLTATTGAIGNWIIDAGGRLTSNEEDPLFVLSPAEDQEGAIRFGSVRIGNGDIQSESLQLNSQSEAIYYTGSSLLAGLSDPGYSFAFVYKDGQLWAYIYGASGLEKQYCITECNDTPPSTVAPTTTTVAPGTTTVAPGTTTTTTTTTIAPPECSDNSDCSPGRICVNGTCVNQTTTTTTATTTTTTAAPAYNGSTCNPGDLGSYGCTFPSECVSNIPGRAKNCNV